MKMLLYSCKTKPYLYGMYSGFETRYGYHLTNDKNVFNAHNVLNGKIVAECDYEVEEIGLVEIPDYAGDGCYMFVSDVSIEFETKTLNQDKLFKKSCLNGEKTIECRKRILKEMLKNE